ncbi:MAG TPA: hypothetical protein VK732_08780 [Verrucomicrobiae bacterium]|nr:hypothetical protein [Verrucomicrobiae bacterium]
MRAGSSIEAPEILVGFAEAYAAIEAAWSLKEAGFRVSAFARAGAIAALRHVAGVRVYSVTPPEVDAARSMHDVRAIVRSINPAAYLPLDDAGVWVAQTLGIEDLRVAGPTGAAASYALDKELQIAAAADAGFLVPPTKLIRSLEDAHDAAYPIVIKPTRVIRVVSGRLVRPKGVVCADASELRTAAPLLETGAALAQPLIAGVGEGLFGHMAKDGVVAWSAHRRLRMVNPQGSASSACASRSPDPALLAPAERFLRAIGWRGLFMLEFLRDVDGRPQFMELNGRTWGSLALARRRGFEYPAWTVRSSLDESFVPVAPADPPDMVCRNLGMELMHLAFVLRGPRSIALRDWPKLWPTIRDLLRVSRKDRLYNWKRSEPSVLAWDTAQTLGFYVRRALRTAR